MYDKEHTEQEFRKWDNSNPFKTPEGYFESFEDRLMGRIEYDVKPRSKSSKFIRMMKPVIGLAASFTLVYLLVYYPINHFLLKESATTETGCTFSADPIDAYSLSLSAVDETTLVNALFSDENNGNKLDSDDMLAYLSSRLNEVEICSEFQN